nr:hypothetical protein CFP56_32428 [Quercus suber]
MDMIQDWAAHFLSNDHAYITTYAYRLFTIVSTLKSWLLPLIDQVARKPDLTSIALLIIILFFSIKILGMVLNSIFGWIRLVFRLVFWISLVVVGMWMWQRGPEGVVDDFQYWVGIWSQEYGYWKDKERVAAMGGRAGLPVQGGGAGAKQTGYGRAKSWF